MLPFVANAEALRTDPDPMNPSDNRFVPPSSTFLTGRTVENLGPVSEIQERSSACAVL